MAGVMPVAIERPDGRLADLLLEAGHPVVPVKPNAIKTWRDGEVLPGAKSDAGDAAVIAEYLRLRAHKLKAAAPYSDETKALRTVVRARGDLVEMRVAATNQLAALLDAHWPGGKAVYANLDSDDRAGFPGAIPHPGLRRQPHRRTTAPGQARLLRREPPAAPQAAAPRPGRRLRRALTEATPPGPARPGHAHRAEGLAEGTPTAPPPPTSPTMPRSSGQGQPRPDHR